MEDKQHKKPFFKYGFHLMLPIILVISIKIISLYPISVEHYYSKGVFPYISYLQRVLFGWLPFSVGDVAYSLFFILMIIKTVKFFLSVTKRKITWKSVSAHSLTSFNAILWIYILFNSLWALNYERLGIASQLNLSNTTYTDEELKDLLCNVVDEINKTRIQLGDSNYVYPTDQQVFDMAINAYGTVKNKFPFLEYNRASIKPSLLTSIVSYAGYAGYYNPFSGEAQVNIGMPKFYMPFVACHEMAHQIGYASESEANLVGYLAAINSKNTLLRYSALFEIFAAANAELMERDFFAAILNVKSLDPLVKRDRRIYKEYILGKQNKIEPVMKDIYDQYLKANQQKSGIKSYDEVVGWVIAYRRKYLKGQSLY